MLAIAGLGLIVSALELRSVTSSEERRRGDAAVFIAGLILEALALLLAVSTYIVRNL